MEKLGHGNGNRIIFMQYALPLVICGVYSLEQINICIMDDNKILLLVQEDKRLFSWKDSELQAIAEAIAVFSVTIRCG